LNPTTSTITVTFEDRHVDLKVIVDKMRKKDFLVRETTEILVPEEKPSK